MSKIFLEDIAYGIFDRPGPAKVLSDEEVAAGDTVPKEVPIVPNNQVANQLTVERPPIEDEEFIPGNVEELSRAASTIAKLVPTDEIEQYYRDLHRILDDATDRSGTHTDDIEDKDTSKEAKKMKENRMTRKVISAINEMLSDKDKEEFESYRSGGIDYFAEQEPQEDTDKGMSLEDLAAEFGYSGPPGVRQEIEKLTNRLEYFAQKVKNEDLEALLDYAVGEYVAVLVAGDFIEQEDADDLLKSPKMVKDLASFRFFFVGTFVLPAYREVVRTATKKVKEEIAKLGIPEVLHQTLFNQVTGGASRNPKLILKKIGDLVKKGEVKESELQSLATKIGSARKMLVAIASDYSDDLVQRSLDKWQKTSKGARQKAIKQALEQTSKA